MYPLARLFGVLNAFAPSLFGPSLSATDAASGSDRKARFDHACWVAHGVRSVTGKVAGLTASLPSPVPAMMALWLLIVAMGFSVAQAQSQLVIASATFGVSGLEVSGQVAGEVSGEAIELYDINGRRLGTTTAPVFHFAIPVTDFAASPCGVRVRAGSVSATLAVTGAPSVCAKTPVCRILPLKAGTSLSANQPYVFKARVKFKDARSKPYRTEWDFAGGVMQTEASRGKQTKTTVSFVRDNSSYRVRFAATDAKGRRCEDSIEVTVGTPLSPPPSVAGLAQAAQASRPTLAANRESNTVVLPYEDWTMQSATDARTVPSLLVAYGPQVSNIKAVAYEKGLQPLLLGDDRLKLTYSASSNPTDPVGPDSINSTSQNWPVGSSLLSADIQKSDWFDADPALAAIGEFGFSYTSFAASTDVFHDPNPAALINQPDEGYHNAGLTPPLNADHGRFMPGIDTPYQINTPQPFTEYAAADQEFVARMLPVTDVDDSGRVNPFPVFRVDARDAVTDAAVAATEMVLTATRDLHCRECHAKGGIAAMAKTRPFGGHGHDGKPSSELLLSEPASDSLFDQEYAAMNNVGRLHTFGGSGEGAETQGWMNGGTPGPLACGLCHASELTLAPYGFRVPDRGISYSAEIHKHHAVLQYNNDRTDLRDRLVTGKAPGFDFANNAGKPNPYSLFPVMDAKGKILPMEQNCLRCHGGQREQGYRDRMFTAGITCYQCHGDMGAMSNGYAKANPTSGGNPYRVAWFDQPDCASCHVGNANRGQTGTPGFFSAGVMNLAFDETDPSASPRRADLFNPDESRFAVVPEVTLDLGQVQYDPAENPQPYQFKTRLYRMGKDTHGKVPCAACHGGAHAIWPNRDPNANDNVTAVQLQGHAGHISECSVCHTADAFAKRDSLDEGKQNADPQAGVLGGPHGLHPVNDPNWWKQADADIQPNQSSGQIKGGWHNDYAKLPGRAGEDQCVACHGNDRRGTRLSRTPVDREFLNDQGETVAVKAGTPIGCDLCHTIEKSCTDAIDPANCGRASNRVAGTTNLAPVIQSTPPDRAVTGETYRYQVQATDPEGGKLHFQIARQPNVSGTYIENRLTIDPETGVIELPVDITTPEVVNVLNGGSFFSPFNPVGRFAYTVMVSDPQGAYAVQRVNVQIECADGGVWKEAARNCVPISIVSQPPLAVAVGKSYKYPVIAKTASGRTLQYSLDGAPAGMAINPKTGLIRWRAQANENGGVGFTVNVSDGAGGTATQPVNLALCTLPDAVSGNACVAPVTVMTKPLPGVTAGDHFHYKFGARQIKGQPMTYSLEQAPPGMTIDSAGMLEWIAQAETSGPISFTIKATDKKGYTAKQTVELTVCAKPERWNSFGRLCDPGIVFNSYPNVAGVDVGQTFSYEAEAVQADGLPLTYGLGSGPEGMTISPTGELSWVVRSSPDGVVGFSVIASDQNGYAVTQDVSGLTVCDAPLHWNPASYACEGPIHFTSIPPSGLTVGDTLIYDVAATHANGLPITLSLEGAYGEPVPEGMTMDVNHRITWDSTGSTRDVVQFQVIGSDGQGNETRQFGYVTLCQAPTHWDAGSGGCAF